MRTYAIIKLNNESVALEFERQRAELEEAAKQPISNEQYIAFLIDTRLAAIDMARKAQEIKEDERS